MPSMAATGAYDLRLVALSVLIAVLSACAALDLAGRVTLAAEGRRLSWLVLGSITMGTGIWAMHYIGMEACRMPFPVLYDWPTVALSMLAAIFASAIALTVTSRTSMSLSSVFLGSLFMGGGIATMHYIGMAAMRVPAVVHYSPALVTLSVIIAVVLAYAGLRIVFAFRDNPLQWSRSRIAGAIVLGLAIAAMHYVGMTGVMFHPAPAMNGSIAHAVYVSSLGLVSIALTAFMLLAAALITLAVDRRLTFRAQQLAESRAQIQAIFDSLKEGVIVLDTDLNIVQMNDAARHLFGFDHPTNYRQIIAAFDIAYLDGTPLPPDRWPTTLALRGEFLHNYEVELRHVSTGQKIIADVSTSSISDSSGQVSQIVVSYRDITRPKQIDEARLRLASIVESSDDAIIGKDTHGIVTTWNKGAERVFGYSPEEIVGQSIRILLPPDRLHEEDEILARIHNGETVEHIETVRRKKNGQLIHVSLSLSPIHDNAGRIIGASKIARNITDRKQLETQLYQSQKMDAIGQLTGGIAHDFNNLLGVIIGNLDLLERLIPTNEAALKRVNTAQKAAGRGAELTRRLLAFSKREPLATTSTPLEHLIRNTLELASRGLGPEIEIITNFASSLPPVAVDPAGFESALLNLIVNARDAMPRGGCITLSTDQVTINGATSLLHSSELRPGRYAYVTLSDTGDGMSHETLERALEPFFTTKEQGKGTGLGLATAYGFFKQSGGTLHLYSELGYGTTVSFYLPIAEPGQLFPPEPQPSTIVHTSTGETILFVDDEEDLLEVGESFLVQAGYTVLIAKSGVEAFQILQQHPDIALLITDIIMPGGINGVELAERARTLIPGIKLIFCSGFPAGALSGRNLPVADGLLLHKPYQRSELLDAVQETLSPTSADRA